MSPSSYRIGKNRFYIGNFDLIGSVIGNFEKFVIGSANFRWSVLVSQSAKSHRSDIQYPIQSNFSKFPIDLVQMCTETKKFQAKTLVPIWAETKKFGSNLSGNQKISGRKFGSNVSGNQKIWFQCERKPKNFCLKFAPPPLKNKRGNFVNKHNI